MRSVLLIVCLILSAAISIASNKVVVNPLCNQHYYKSDQSNLAISSGPRLKAIITQKALEKMTKKINDLNKKRKCKRGPGAMYFVWLSLIILVALVGIAAFIYVFSNMKV